MNRIPLSILIVAIALPLAFVLLARGNENDLPQVSELTSQEPFATAIADDGFSFVGGNPDGDVTVIEYFDYRCGYCRQVRADLLRLVDEDKGVRLVLKEYPVLGKSSVAIARVAMAALRQSGKDYWRLHNALMSEGGQLSQIRALAIAEHLGFDGERLRKDMADARVAEQISQTREEGRRLGITGTPAFMIGGKLKPGAISYSDMTRAVRAARQKPQA